MGGDSPFLPEHESDPEDLPTPWGFRITLIAVAAYLLWRVIQAVIWLAERIF